jgi:hypothetical protein
MKTIREQIESDASIQSIIENSAAGRIPIEGDYIRFLKDIKSIKKGDTAEIVEIVSMEDTAGTVNSFSLSVETSNGKIQDLELSRDEIDSTIEFVYDTTM